MFLVHIAARLSYITLCFLLFIGVLSTDNMKNATTKIALLCLVSRNALLLARPPLSSAFAAPASPSRYTNS